MFQLLKKLVLPSKKAKESATLQFIQLLHEENDTSLVDVVDRIVEAIPLAGSIDETDKENAVGRAVAHAAIIQSGRVQQDVDDAVVKLIVKDLMRLRMRTDEAAAISVHTLIQLVKIVPSGTFATCVWPKLERILSVGWVNCTTDRLLILLTSLLYHQEIVPEQFLLTNWGCSDVVSAGNYHHIIALLQSVTKADMAFLDTVSNYVFNSNCREKPFWASVINGCLLNNKDTRYQDIAFTLIDRALSHYKTHKQLLMMLSPKFFCIVLKRFNVTRKKQKDAQLQPIKDMLSHLVQHVIGVGDDTLHTTVVDHFIDHNQHVGFDEATHTKTLSPIIHKMSHESGKHYAEKLKTILNSDSKSKNVRVWSLSQLASLVTLPSLGGDSEFQTALLSYLARHALFVENEAAPTPIDCQLRSMILKQLYRALNSLSTYKPVGSPRDPVKYIGTVHTVVSHIQGMLADESLQLAEEMKEETLQEWLRMFKRVNKIRKKTPGDKLSEGHAFQLLLLHMGLQLFSEPDHASQILKEVYQCYDKAFLKRRRSAANSSSDSENEEPEWIDVVTEVLVSLLCQPSHLARKIAQSVYSLLHEHVTLASVDIIVNVLIPEEEDSDMMFMNDNEGDDDDLSDDDSDDENDDDDDDDAAGHKDSDGDSGVEDDQGSVDDAFRRTVEAALGRAAVTSDGEEGAESDGEGEDEDRDGDDRDGEDEVEERDGEVEGRDGEDEVEVEGGDGEDEGGDDAMSQSSDMSDEAMLRLDSTLSEVFRSQFKNKKDTRLKREQVQNLKFRALDLLEGLTQPSTLASPKVLLGLFKPLLILMDQRNNDDDSATLANKANHIFCAILKQKKYIMESTLDVEALHVLMSEIVDFSKTSSKEDLIDAAAKGYMSLLSSVLRQGCNETMEIDNETKQTKVDADRDQVFAPLSALLKDCLTKADSHLRESFFKKMIKLNPLLMWPLNSVLVECIGDSNLKVYKRTQAALMLSFLINKSVFNDVGEDKWRTFISPFMAAINQALGPMKASELRPKFLYNLLDVLNKCVTLDRASLQSIPRGVIDKLQSLQENMNKDCRKVWLRVYLQYASSSDIQGESSKAPKRKLKYGDATAETGSNQELNESHESGRKRKRKRKKSASE